MSNCWHPLLAWLKTSSNSSAEWLVRDLTGAEPSMPFATRAAAEAWVQHLWEWKPLARPVVELLSAHPK